MNMQDFAQYIQNKSFDEELHKARQKSMERILTTESLTENRVKKPKENQLKKTA
jgi:hypothetical protein